MPVGMWAVGVTKGKMRGKYGRCLCAGVGNFRATEMQAGITRSVVFQVICKNQE